MRSECWMRNNRCIRWMCARGSSRGSSWRIICRTGASGLCKICVLFIFCFYLFISVKFLNSVNYLISVYSWVMTIDFDDLAVLFTLLIMRCSGKLHNNNSLPINIGQTKVFYQNLYKYALSLNTKHVWHGQLSNMYLLIKYTI